MGIAARDRNEAPETLLLRLKAGSHPAISRLDELSVIRATDRGVTYRGRCAGEGWSVVVKTYAGADAAEKARRLYDQHRYAFERCDADPALRVPEPLAGFSDPPGYAMRFVSGRAASSIVKWALVSRDRTRAELLDRAARWLRAFHTRCDWQPSSRFSPPFLLRDLEERFAAPDRAGAVPHPAEFARGLAVLREAAPRLPAVTFPKALMHGDFNLHNLIVGGDVTWSIDFAGGPANVRPVSFDVACCLFHLEFRDGWPAADRAGTPGGFDRGAVEIFARAYPDLPWQSPEAAWLFLHHQLRKWISLPRLNMLDRSGIMLDMCRHAAATLQARLP